MRVLLALVWVAIFLFLLPGAVHAKPKLRCFVHSHNAYVCVKIEKGRGIHA